MQKYPRTPHLPWSLGRSADDLGIQDLSALKAHPLVVTEKMDGENTTMTRDRCYARSPDSADHESRHYVKGLWGGIRHSIPEGMRISGENMYAVHSIEYDDLHSYFLVHSVFDDNAKKVLPFNKSWDIAEQLGLHWAPIQHEDLSYDQVELLHPHLAANTREGYVVRNKEGFPTADWELNVAKYVRADHVQTDEHWMHQQVRKNHLA